ncbi:MATE family efflux transporter [Pseudolabrys sp. Root1462]|uniref:MATE family efflux transporter n=1 Tax=Pseudolabrys sp. Root1462 TaxID=1736466 RepID=UPI0007031C44|nr:MATE family efflux transporter [Pseudolabrys sp. Root1462]KQZ00157.1 MATE family efflux transporter [Pseudolabrys sp. Root1462]
MDSRTRMLLEAPVAPTIMRLGAPNVLVMLVQASIGLIETYFIAKLGLDPLAGVAIVFPLVMLLTMISAGAMGGGIMSAVARALGAGDRARANELVWSAVAISILLGAVIAVLALAFGPKLYALMGGKGGSLAAATTYAGIVFSGAIPLWLYNSLAAVIRGTGNMIFPASVMVIGAIVLIPLSPALIFGVGPFPHFGVAGGAIAVVAYYFIGCFVFIWYLWSGRGMLKPPRWPKRIARDQLFDILNVGATSSIVSLSTNISIATATGLAGIVGAAALAGYGTGARLEYLLVPLVFGLGAPVAAMVGTAVGAGNHDRALRVAWTGAAIAFVLTEAIGIAAALFPATWLTLFGAEREMIATGSEYLRVVGPTYGFFGGGLLLYFASQGAGRVGAAMVVAVVRVAIAAGGGYAAVVWFHGGSMVLFAVLAAALMVYGLLNAVAVASGVWFRHRVPVRLMPQSLQAAPAAPDP